MNSVAPAGFGPLPRSSPFLDTVGPIYCKGSGGDMAVGFSIQTKHLNARGLLHGGMISTVADIALGFGLATSSDGSASLVTASMTIDFAGPAELGDWLETRVEILKLGSRLGFANAYFWRGTDRIARASGVFLVIPRK